MVAFFFQAEDGIRDLTVTGVQTCALPISALAVFALFVLAPLAHSMWLSLFEWDGVTPGTWVGLDNYGQVMSDAELRAEIGRASCRERVSISGSRAYLKDRWCGRRVSGLAL